MRCSVETAMDLISPKAQKASSIRSVYGSEKQPWKIRNPGTNGLPGHPNHTRRLYKHLAATATTAL